MSRSTFAVVSPRVAALASAAAAVAAVFPTVARAQSTGLDTCTDVHIFLARGNNEPYPGRQGTLVDAICSGLDSCDYEDIAFDNAIEVDYCVAIEAGVKAGTDQITAYNERCPDAKLVLSGYSQGAQVIGDILGGGGGTFFNGCTTPTTSALDADAAPGNMIYAAALFGDVRHAADQSYDVLDGSSFAGVLARTGDSLAALNNFADVLRDYCQYADPICATGDGNREDTVVADHLNYFDKFSDAAGEWVKSMTGTEDDNGDGDDGSSSTASSSAATPTPSTTGPISSTGGVSSSTSAPATNSSSSSPTTTLMTSGMSPLPEATATTSVAEPTETSAGESGAGVMRCFTGLLGVVAFGSMAFLTV
ncbi:carbohydrate esterase family 5 protein [Xylariomycetidae sp. FL2044]|nr:carbohydrate esterase family 5 protein [Xylariomycetidae sp. FL2044]